MVDLIHQFMDMSDNSKLFVISTILILAVAQSLVSLFRKLGFALLFFLFIHLSFFVFLLLTFKYSLNIHLFYVIPSIPLAMIFQIFRFSIKRTKNDPLWTLTIPTNEGKNLKLQNIKRGISTFGSAGVGKTESGFVPIIKHMAERNFAGINYDYKDGELTEITNFFYKDNEVVANYIVAPAKSERE